MLFMLLDYTVTCARVRRRFYERISTPTRPPDESYRAKPVSRTRIRFVGLRALRRTDAVRSVSEAKKQCCSPVVGWSRLVVNSVRRQNNNSNIIRHYAHACITVYCGLEICAIYRIPIPYYYYCRHLTLRLNLLSLLSTHYTSVFFFLPTLKSKSNG